MVEIGGVSQLVASYGDDEESSEKEIFGIGCHNGIILVL